MKCLFFNSFLILSTISYSQWSLNPNINTPVAIANRGQSNVHMVSDGKRGTIIAWEDNRNNPPNSVDIYAQRLKNNGVEKWTSNGVAICNNAFKQQSVAITQSDNGSAIITWEDNRMGNFDIYAQKIDSVGNVLWTTNGIAVVSKITTQKNPKVISDNAGGAIIVWEDSVNFYWDVYAQRISNFGIPLWNANGIAVCNAPNLQLNPKIDSDGLGGAVITWQDKRLNVDYDIYAQRIDASGSALWTANGVVICNAVNVQNNPRIEPDGASGAYICWTDKRLGTQFDIYAQRINGNGAIQWANNGVSICSAINNQSAHDMKYNGSGILISWKDDRNGSNAIYSQLLNENGVPQLATNGVLISNSLKSINPNTEVDGLGGAIIVWQDSTALGWDIKTQKIDGVGNLKWTLGGQTVCSASFDQINATLIGDGNGGAIFAWEDYRNVSNYDIYAHRIYNAGSANAIQELNSLIIKSNCVPNPITNNGHITLQYTGNDALHITIYDALGAVIQNNKTMNNASFVIQASDFATGVYFYSIQLSNQVISKGIFNIIK